MNHFRAHFQTTPAPHREWVWRRRHRSRTLATRPRSGRRPAAHASDPRAGRARRSRRAAPREPGASAGRPWASCPSTRDPCFEAVGLGVSEAADLTFGDADFAEGRLDAEQGRRGPQVLARADRARARSPKRRPSAPSSGSLAHPMLQEAMSRPRAIWDAWDQSPVSVSNRRFLYRFGTPVTFAYLVFLLSLGQWVAAAISGHAGPASAGIASRRRHVSSRTAT